jgi:hypothetical protein
MGKEATYLNENNSGSYDADFMNKFVLTENMSLSINDEVIIILIY